LGYYLSKYLARKPGAGFASPKIRKDRDRKAFWHIVEVANNYSSIYFAGRSQSNPLPIIVLVYLVSLTRVVTGNGQTGAGLAPQDP